MDDKIKINLQMAGQRYSLTIDRNDEQAVREAAKRVDKRFGAYRSRYTDEVSSQKILAMVAYQFALENIRLEQRQDTQPYADKIRELTQLLDNYLKE